MAVSVEYDTQLMKNQIHGSVMDSHCQCAVLQGQNGFAELFSLDHNGVFYLTEEVSASATGWNQVDLSSSLSQQIDGVFKVTNFAVSQDPQYWETVDLAITVQVQDSVGDRLFLALNQLNNFGETGVNWVYIPTNQSNLLHFADVYLSRTPSAGATCFVDVLRQSDDPRKILDRYCIETEPSPCWQYSPLPDIITQGGTVSCMGKKANDSIGGIYTFGFIGSDQMLVYCPASTPNNPLPESTQLEVPLEISTIASVPDLDGNTSLYTVCPTLGIIFIYLSDHQNPGDEPQAAAVVNNLIVESGLLTGTSHLEGASDAERTVLWGLNGAGELYSLYCPAGQETIPSAWTNPVSIFSNVFQFASYIQDSARALFVQTSDNKLQRLIQDPETSVWSACRMILPPNDVRDMTEVYSYTTHIQVIDSCSMGVPNVLVNVESSSPMVAYINDQYYTLTPNYGLQVETSVAGVLTVIQQTQTLAGVCFKIWVYNESSQKTIVAEIDPHANVWDNLANISTTDNLRSAQVTNADGITQPLVPQTTMEDQLTATAELISNLLYLQSNLPSNGVKQPTPLPPPPNGLGKHSKRWSDQHAESGDIGDLVLAWGDLARWLKRAWKTVSGSVIRWISGFYYFLVDTGEVIYTAILDTISAVAGAAEYVLQQVGVKFDDMVKYLGFVFDWNDILITHRVIKNVIRLAGNRVVLEIDQIEQDVQNAFSDLEQRIRNFGNIPVFEEPIGMQIQQQSEDTTHTSPQANWAIHHATSNIMNADTPYRQQSQASKDLQDAVQALFDLVSAEEYDLTQMAKDLKAVVFDQFRGLTVTELISSVMGILEEFLLKSARNGIMALFEVLKLLVREMFDFLDSQIDIPILTPFYESITGGSPFTFLDLVCLLVAIPVNLAYKAMTKTTPFPDTEFTQMIITAPTWDTLAGLIRSGGTSANRLTKFAGRSFAHTAKVAAQSGSDVYSLFAIMSDIGAGAATIFYMMGSLDKSNLPPSVPAPRALRYLITGSYLVYVMPNIIGSLSTWDEWPTDVNWGVTAVSLMKTAADNCDLLNGMSGVASIWKQASSPVEVILNIVWLVPAFGSVVYHHDQASDYFGLAANLMFDFGGIVSPFLMASLDPETKATGEAAFVTSSLGYAGCSIATALALQGDW